MHASYYLKGYVGGDNDSTHNKILEDLKSMSTRYSLLKTRFEDIADKLKAEINENEIIKEKASVNLDRIKGLEEENKLLHQKISMLENALSDKTEEIKLLLSTQPEPQPTVADTSVIETMLNEIKELNVKISSTTAGSKNALTEDQAGEVIDFILHLEKEYFSDMPVAQDQVRLFIQNVPYRMYHDMIQSLDHDEPDILNPVVLLYLTFVDEPGWVMGHFLTKLKEMIEENEDDVMEDNVDYIEYLLTDTEEEEPNDGQNESE